MKRVVKLAAGVVVWLASCAAPPSSTACPVGYCASHGACTEVNALPSCACDVGYDGLNCSTCVSGFHRIGLATCAPDETCEATTCGAHGTCNTVAGVVQCECAQGYDGPRCDVCYGAFLDVSDAGLIASDAGLVRAGPAECIAPARCTGGTCPLNFTCDDSTGTVSCACTSADCTACTPTTCGGHGTCDEPNGRTRCTCAPGYQGAACDTCYFGYHDDGAGSCVQNERCTATSCGQGGACAVVAGVAACTCAAGFEGTHCEACSTGYHRTSTGSCDVDQACASNSCPTSASCVISGGVVTCPCRTGYAGSGCGQCYPGFHSVDAGVGGDSCLFDQHCEPTSCGRGTCEDATGTVVCTNCPTGFTGAHCEVNIDDCGTACAQGQCVDLVASRICLCSDGTYGQSCLQGPGLTSIVPAFGPRAGGNSITLNGTGFVSGLTVTIGGVSASVTGFTATTVTLVVPASMTLGPTEVVVRAPNGQLARGTYAYAPQAFLYTGVMQSFTVPAGVTSLNVSVWGAAGGAGDSTAVLGGAGGYSTGTLSVDAGQVLSILVGQGGARFVSAADAGAGAGGGLSGIFLPSADGGVSQAAALILAGGGGGGGLYASVATGSSGGNGGGLFGGDGAATGTTSFAARGLGGSVQGGGIGGCSTAGTMAQCGQTGLALQGGGGGVAMLTDARVGATFGGGGGVGPSSTSMAGGGGGGYFGGGGGANETPQGGGGGAGFLAAGVINGATARASSPGVPQGQGALGYVSGVGVGGNVTASTSGGPGLVLIGW